jgi:hypothetical protein
MALHTFIIKHPGHMPRISTITSHMPSLVALRLRVPAGLPFRFVSFFIRTSCGLSAQHRISRSAQPRTSQTPQEGARSVPDKTLMMTVTVLLFQERQWPSSIGILPHDSLMTHGQTLPQCAWSRTQAMLKRCLSLKYLTMLEVPTMLL